MPSIPIFEYISVLMSVSNQLNDSALKMPAFFHVLHTSTVFVLAFHFFAIYVISEYSPKQMKAYARYLLAYEIVTTLTDLIVMWLLAPLFTFPVVGIIPTGPLSALGVSTLTQGMFGGAALLFTGLSITELFFQRQQSIVPYDSYMKLKLWQIHIWHLFLFLLATISLVGASVIMSFNECDREEYARWFPTLKHLIFHREFMCLGGDGILVNRVFQVVEAVLIPVIVFLIATSIYHLSNYKMSSKKTQDMQKKLFKILIIQTVAPLVFLLIPGALVYYISMKGDVELVVLNPWILFMFCLHGPCSTILILLLYAPYYRYVKSLFLATTSKGNKGSKRTSMVTVGYSKTSINGVSVVGISNVRPIT